MAMDQVDDSISQIGREVRSVIDAAVLVQAAGYIDSWVALGESQFHIGISLVVTQQNVEARFFLLDEVILECQSLFVVGYDYVVDVDRFADQRAGFGVLPAAFVEIGRDTGAEVLGLADVDDLAFGVLVEVDAGEVGMVRILAERSINFLQRRNDVGFHNAKTT
jgi:hypothetical protein